AAIAEKAEAQWKADDLRRRLFEAAWPRWTASPTTSNAAPRCFWFEPQVEAWAVVGQRTHRQRMVVRGSGGDRRPGMAIAGVATNEPGADMTDLAPEPGAGRVSIRAGESWLATRFDDDPRGYWLVCWPEANVITSISDLVNSTVALPDYLG